MYINSFCFFIILKHFHYLSSMNKTQEQLEKLREVAESSLNKTEELQKVLAQIEALMSRTENQKVRDKSKE